MFVCMNMCGVVCLCDNVCVFCVFCVCTFEYMKAFAQACVHLFSQCHVFCGCVYIHMYECACMCKRV